MKSTGFTMLAGLAASTLMSGAAWATDGDTSSCEKTCDDACTKVAGEIEVIVTEDGDAKTIVIGDQEIKLGDLLKLKGDRKFESVDGTVTLVAGEPKVAKSIGHAYVLATGDEREKKEIKVIVEDGEAKVWVDGKLIDSGELHEKLIHEYMPKYQTFTLKGGDAKHIGEAMGDYFVVRDRDFAPPKVMMGVTLETIGPALASHLRMDPASVVMLGDVHDDLPAAMAGLKKFDIIVAVDGQAPVGPDQLTKYLAKHEPGDVVVLKVIRGGEPTKATVKLAPWDSTVMGKAAPKTWTGDAEFGMAGERWKQLFELAEDGHGNVFKFQPQGELSIDIRKHLDEALGKQRKLLIEQYEDAREAEGKAKVRLRAITPDMLKKLQGLEEVGIAELQIEGLHEHLEGLHEHLEGLHVETADKDDLQERMDELEAKLRRIEKLLKRLGEND
jgi:hypothetical protein